MVYIVIVKKSGFAVVEFLVGAIVIGAIAAGVYFYYFSDNRDGSTIDLTPTPSTIVSPTSVPEATPVANVTFEHDDLPGFSFNYPDDWSVQTIKEFGDASENNFDSRYFPTCHDRCMGVRLAKSDVSIDFVFDVAFDSSGLRCSNSVTYEMVGGDWYRITDSTGVFYSKTVELEKSIVVGGTPYGNIGEITDEWSVVENNTYDICYSGSGNFLNEWSQVETGENGEGVPILMEFPTIDGSPGNLLLNEIDTIILSITY